MAPTGSGKGTQALKLAETFNLYHISTGDLFRNEISNETPLGLEAKKYMTKGELVPDEVTIGMLSNKLDEQAGKVEGFIFNQFGKVVRPLLLDINQSQSEVNINDLNDGLYIVWLTDGNWLFRSKFIVKRA